MFVTARDTAVFPREPHNYLKTEIISKLGVLTSEQLEKLTSGASDHPDQAVRDAAFGVMSHSKEVARTNYLVTSGDRSTKFSSDVLKNKGLEQPLKVSSLFFFLNSLFTLINAV